MIAHVLEGARALNPRSVTVVVGHQAEAVKSALAGHPGLTFVVQEPQLGTGHALLMAEPALRGACGTVILLSGDVPLLSPQTLQALIDCHHSRRSGRHGCDRDRRRPRTDTGASSVPASGLHALSRSGTRPRKSGASTRSTPGSTRSISRGCSKLSAASRAKTPSANTTCPIWWPSFASLGASGGNHDRRQPGRDTWHQQPRRARRSEPHRETTEEQRTDGLRGDIEDPATTYIDRTVAIAADTIVHPGVSLEGQTTIGAGCEIHSGARIVNSRIGDRVTVLNHCVITDSRHRQRRQRRPVRAPAQ